MWRLLGKFSACSFCANFFGALGWGCYAHAIASYYRAGDASITSQQQYLYFADCFFWLVPWLVGYGVEVLCMYVLQKMLRCKCCCNVDFPPDTLRMSISKLMVLDRLVSHIVHSSQLSHRKIRYAYLALIAAIIVLGSIGLVANFAVSVYVRELSAVNFCNNLNMYNVQTAQAFKRAADACLVGGNSTAQSGTTAMNVTL